MSRGLLYWALPAFYSFAPDNSPKLCGGLAVVGACWAITNEGASNPKKSSVVAHKTEERQNRLHVVEKPILFLF
jgi:hypothetical protein